MNGKSIDSLINGETFLSLGLHRRAGGLERMDSWTAVEVELRNGPFPTFNNSVDAKLASGRQPVQLDSKRRGSRRRVRRGTESEDEEIDNQLLIRFVISRNYSAVISVCCDS